MDTPKKTQRLRIEAALSARLELLSGGVSGASTYRVHGLPEPCVLKVTKAESSDEVRARGHREIHFYNEIAARIPLHTPRVLASLIEESGYCTLLLEAYAPMQPANELDDAEFAEIAKQLGRFHAVHWNQTDQLDTFSWLDKPKIVDLTNDVRHASETWQLLAQQPQFRDLLTDSRVRDIKAALAEVRTKPEYGHDTPMTLCHGDCHLENLLSDQEGRLIWADWQEVRIGYGPTDLSFLIQRAETNGANIAHDSVVAAYCNALEASDVRGVNEAAITSAMNESERRTRLLYWPDYLRDATSEAMVHHLSRIFLV
jgi:Ser/Thr protein kinase RdoA (MazF antagonist)